MCVKVFVYICWPLGAPEEMVTCLGQKITRAWEKNLGRVVITAGMKADYNTSTLCCHARMSVIVL